MDYQPDRCRSAVIDRQVVADRAETLRGVPSRGRANASCAAQIASSRTPIASAEPAWLYPSLGLPTGRATPGRLDTPSSIAPPYAS